MENKKSTSLLSNAFENVERFKSCEQCGECSSACPLSGINDFNIRRILRHIELGLIEEIANTPYAWQCTTCGRCETVCPNGIAILDIIRALRILAPKEYVPSGPPSCIKACPGEIDIPGYLRFIAQGEPQKAYELILEAALFPGILGRVCTHPCEENCQRAIVNQAVSICALKRYAADKASEIPKEVFSVAKDTDRKVAVVGAGPAGLTAAFFLRKKGHSVTIFESNQKAGGMMRYGIPRYRLPEEVLDKEIDQVLSIGIDVKTNVKFGKDLTLAQLKEYGFDAVFIATGLQQSKKINIDSANINGILWGIDFLKDVGNSKKVEIKNNVVVIGGGDVAIDVALTCLRLGAKKVTLVCLESKVEMPAHPWEIRMALTEGVVILNSWGPKKIIEENGRVRGIELIACKSIFDNKGIFNPVFGNETKQIRADQVVFAIGQTSDLGFVKDSLKLEIAKDLIVVDQKTGQTNEPGIFAGGEITTGPGALIQAIADGKKVASTIDKFLGGNGIVQKTWAQRPLSDAYNGKREKGFADQQRLTALSLPLSERHNGFLEVECCFEEEVAIKEAKRCLQCDLELTCILKK